MTFEEIVVLIGLAGLLVAGGTSAFRIPPLAVLVSACVPSALVLALTMRESDTPCGSPGMGRAAAHLFETCTVLALILWVAAAAAGIVKGTQLAKAGREEAALLRYLGYSAGAMLGGGAVFLSFLSAALHCIN